MSNTVYSRLKGKWIKHTSNTVYPQCEFEVHQLPGSTEGIITFRAFGANDFGGPDKKVISSEDMVMIALSAVPV